MSRIGNDRGVSTWITARCSRRVLAGGLVIAGALVIAVLRRPEASAARVRAWAKPHPMAVRASGALVPVTGHARTLPKAPGEPLFEFYVERDHARWLCELRDHGAYGIEARFWRNEKVVYSRRFDTRMDPTRPPREQAVQWAEEERKALEKGPSGRIERV